MVKPVLWAFTSLDLKGMLLKVPFASVVSWQSQDHVHFPESWPHPCGSSRLMNAFLLGDSHILYLLGQHTQSASSKVLLRTCSTGC